MALERERRAIGFEKEDERRRVEKLGLVEKLEGLGLGDVGMEEDPGVREDEPMGEKKSDVAPNVALMGVSMLGSELLCSWRGRPTLMIILQILMRCTGTRRSTASSSIRSSFPPSPTPPLILHFRSLTTGSRQRPGALLLFAYTFAGKLWFSLGYDVNGFKEGVVENWWSELQTGVDEFLLA